MKATEQMNYLEKLPESLKKIVITKGEPSYNRVRSSYMKVGTPEIVIMAENETHVSEAVQFISNLRKETGENIPFSVRSGGHGMSGSSTNNGGVLLDLSKMNKIEVVDEAKKLVRIQAGANWGNVAKALAPYDLLITSGNFGDVGVGGIASSGGIGYFVRSEGLTIDHIKGVTLVTADGVIHHLDEENEPELFWGVRGGGTQLGVLTEVLFEAIAVNSDSKDASIIYQNVVYSTENIAGFVKNWGEWIKKTPNEMTSFLMLQKSGAKSFHISATNVWATTDVEKATPYLEQAVTLEKIVDHRATIVSYPNIIPHPESAHMGQQRIQIWNALLDQADSQLGKAIEESFSNPNTLAMELRSIGGVMNEVAPDATAWAARHQEAFISVWMQPTSQVVQEQAFAPIQKLSTGVYGAYSSNTTPEVANLAWPGETGKRLKTLMDQVDPDHLFDQGIHL